ncbi:MAG: CcmD family protein [Ignavibacteria bacterium]|nr:CcmD family protein [Ignavibacteria bacterium]
MEQFFHDNSIFIVLTIVLIIIFGIGMYMFSIDRKLTKIEKTYKEYIEQNNND